MDKSLQMVFQNQAGKNVTINLASVRDDLTETEVKTLMQLIITKNIFDSTGGDLITIMSANTVARDIKKMVVR